MLNGCSGGGSNAPVAESVLDVTAIKDLKTRRISSWDQTGGNKDWITIEPGETKTLADIPGSGSIQHFYFTTAAAGPMLRELVLRMYWDGENSPSVEVPLGDFFLTGQGAVRHLRSTFVTINTGRSGFNSHGFNSISRCLLPRALASPSRTKAVKSFLEQFALKLDLGDTSDTADCLGTGGDGTNHRRRATRTGRSKSLMNTDRH